MSISRILFSVSASVLVAGGLLAQGNRPAGAWIGGPGLPGPAARVSVPVMGYFFDRGNARLQPVLGMPGNGFLGPAGGSGAGAAVLAISPAQDYALAALADSGGLAVIALDGGAMAAVPVAGAMAGISTIAISPGGAAALVYSAAAGKAQVFTGFPGSPNLAREFDWSTLPGRITAAAIDDAGDLALVAAQAGTVALFAVSVESGAVLIGHAQAIAGIEFFRDSRQAVAADPAGNQAIWIQDHSGVPSPVILADAGSGLSGPLAAAVSQDGSRVFVLDAAGLLAIPLAGGLPARASCACQPSAFQRMRGRDVFLLTPSPARALAVLDAGDGLNLMLMPAEPAQTAAANGGKRQ